MKSELKIAIIGVGRAPSAEGADSSGGFRIGYTHAGMYQKQPRTKLVAAADINAENLKVFQTTFGLEQTFTDYRDMLETIKPDIVSICTYVGLHRKMIEDAARFGVKGIVCEKPFLAAPADLDAIRALVSETGVKIVVPHIRRYYPAFEQAKTVYASGEIGMPVLCFAGIKGWDLAEWGSHWLDMFRYFHDDKPAEWVFGAVRVRERRGFGHAMEDHSLAHIQFMGGGRALLDGGKPFNGSHTMTLLGSEGTIRIIDEAKLVIETQTGTRYLEYQADFAGSWDKMLGDLLQWLDGGEEPMLGLSNALAASELYLAAYLSARIGDRIDLPLHDNLEEWPLEGFPEIR
jgi:predicted dehydrogenase